jgi:hypothetical protein
MGLGVSRSRLFALSAAAGLAGCNLLDSLRAPPREGEPGGQAVTVTLTPPSATVPANGTVAFAATVTGSAEASVLWSVVPGTGCGSITPGGLYTAPGLAASCQVLATSVADPARSGSASVTVIDVSVAVAPPSAGVNACRSLAFTADVAGAPDRTVTWSVAEAGGGTVGASSGVYTAPSTEGTYHVVATSNADPTRRATAEVTVSTKVLSVSVSPAVVSIAPNGAVQLRATVTTTCGSTTATQTLHGDGRLTR